MLADTDLAAAVRLHRSEMGAQFLSRFGPRFLTAYYRAYLEGPDGLALAAVEAGTGRLLGILLGASCPAAHYRRMVRRHGVRLAGLLLLGAAGRPPLAVDLVRTRSLRYARGLLRLVLAQLAGAGRWAGRRRAAPAASTPGGGTGFAGEVTVVAVDPAARRRGVGRALLEAAAERAAQAGATRLELVTPEDELGAVRFYEQLGWRCGGRSASRSGEQFLRFDRPLSGGDDRRGRGGGARTY